MDLYLIRISNGTLDKLLLCNGKKKVLKKIEEYIWEEDSLFIHWLDYLENTVEELTDDLISNLSLFKNNHCTFNGYTFYILDVETI